MPSETEAQSNREYSQVVSVKGLKEFHRAGDCTQAQSNGGCLLEHLPNRAINNRVRSDSYIDAAFIEESIR